MRNGFGPDKAHAAKIDLSLLVILLLLIGVGVSMLFTASYTLGVQNANDPFLYLKSQAKGLVPGILAALLVIGLNEKHLRKLIPLALIVSLLLCLLPFIPGLGSEKFGGKRWVEIGSFGFQPSEILKVTVVLYLAHMLDLKKDRVDDPLNTLLPLLIVLLVSSGIVIMQNDFTTAFFIFGTGIIVVFLSSVRLFYFFGLAVLVGALGFVFIFSSEYRVLRFLGFLMPNADLQGINYQVSSANSALVNGGFWGVGIGQGVHKGGAVPVIESDFIVAAVGEEFGFIGIVLLISLFIAFAIRSVQVSLKGKNDFYTLMGIGLTVSIVLQALLNIAVVPGLMPTTGIPLPFFSKGGSSLLVSCVMAGLLLHISVRGRREYG